MVGRLRDHCDGMRISAKMRTELSLLPFALECVPGCVLWMNAYERTLSIKPASCCSLERSRGQLPSLFIPDLEHFSRKNVVARSGRN